MDSPAFQFVPEEWFTPNTYDTNFKEPPPRSGVYLIVYPKIEGKKIVHEILYVGSSKKLCARYRSHEVRRILLEVYGYVQFFFKEVEHYLEKEKELIRAIQPKYNKQWR